MDNKVKFLRGTATEYEASTKDNDTFYYTTDTKKLYLGGTEITGIEIDDTSTTATDKTWSAKKINDSIPTELPANGGNADTVDGKHYFDFVNYLGEITDVDNILNNPKYGDCSYEGIISSNVATSIGLSSAVATEWSIKCFRATDGSGFQIAVPIYRNSGESPKYRIANKYKLNGSDYVVEWGDWNNFSDNGNADTVDGKHANDFVDVNDTETQIEIPSDTNNPIDVPMWIQTNGKRYTRYFTYGSSGRTNVPNNSGTWVWYYFDGNNIIAREYITDNVWTAAVVNGAFTGWKLINSSDADTVDGLHANEIASNPNLLINPDFAVNQRGVSGTITTAGYFVDCWKLASGEVTVNSDGTITLDGTISQTLENAVGDNATASASAGTASYDNSTKTFTLTATGENIAWAKLELGSIATPFCPPNPATELAKCQRYFCKSYLPETAPGTARAYSGEIILNAAGSSKFGQSYIAFPVSMRIIPTVTIFNPDNGESGGICHSGYADTISAAALVPGTNGFNISAVGLTQGDDYYMHYTASAEI